MARSGALFEGQNLVCEALKFPPKCLKFAFNGISNLQFTKAVGTIAPIAPILMGLLLILNYKTNLDDFWITICTCVMQRSVATFVNDIDNARVLSNDALDLFRSCAVLLDGNLKFGFT